MASYKTVFGSYLKSEDLQGKVVNIQIENVTVELVKDADSDQKEKKLVAHFVGRDKSMILNRTNADALNAIFGTDDYDYWKGPIQLFVDPNVRMGNRVVGGLRIRAVGNTAPVAPPPPPVAVTEDDIPFTWVMPFLAPLSALGLAAGAMLA